MDQAFTPSVYLKIQKTIIETQKIDCTTLKTYSIIGSIFSIFDKDNRVKFFKKGFLLTDIKSDMVLEKFS